MNSSRDDQFTERHVEWQSALDRLFVTLVPDPADAEGLFPEASLSAWNIRDRFDPLREMSPWLSAAGRPR